MVGRPEIEGMASAFLNSLLGVFSIACARTVLTARTGAEGRAAERLAALRETFIVVDIVET